MRNAYAATRALGRGLFLTALALAAGTAHGQILNLPPTAAQSLAGTYTDLTATGTAIATANFDDANSAAQDIGFSFTFGGTAFTQFVLNTNGYVKLGTTAPPTPYFSTTPLSVDNGPLNGAGTYLLVPFNTDLEAAAVGGAEYRVATTGTAPNRVCTIQWKNVSDKARMAFANTIDKQFASFSFQLKLYETTNQVEFVYGPVVAASGPYTNSYYSFAHVGLKGAGSGQLQVLTVKKNGTTTWNAPTFQAGTYPQYTNGFIFTSIPPTGGSAPLPDLGRTYRFSVPVANDLAVSTLYSIEQLPAGQAFAYRAYIVNAGSTSVSGQTATLTLTGANAQTTSVAIPTLAAGASTTVRFPGLVLAAAGTTTATVAMPADGNNTNNTQAATTLTTAGGGYFSYISAATPSSGSTSFLYSSTGAYTSAFAVKYQARTPQTLNVVRARIGVATDNAGNVVYGVIADTTGRVLAQSAPYTMQAGDNNTLHTFVLTAPVQVPAGGFLAGLAQVIPSTFTYPSPIAYQPELPTRPGTYYQFGITTPSMPVDITLSADPGYRYLIDAGYSTTLATTAPTLAGTLNVYPNPSTNGVFTLDVRGASTGALAVEVRNTLGQPVYAGTTHSESITTVDLSHLAAGVYLLQVRGGSAIASRKVVVAR